MLVLDGHGQQPGLVVVLEHAVIETEKRAAPHRGVVLCRVGCGPQGSLGKEWKCACVYVCMCAWCGVCCGTLWCENGEDEKGPERTQARRGDRK